MGTSMTISEKQKLRLHIRNHAIPRKDLGPDLDKHYRYRVQHLKNRPSAQNQNNVPFKTMKIQKNNIQMGINFEHILPNDIPSIEEHSGIMKTSKSDSSLTSNKISDSVVQQYAIARQSKNFNDLKIKQQGNEQSYDNIFMMKQQGADKIKQKQKIEENNNSLKNQQNIYEIKRQSNPNQNRASNTKKSSQGGKTSNDKISSSVSNHVLSQIILKREIGFYTVNYEDFQDDINQNTQSLQKQRYLTQQNFQQAQKRNQHIKTQPSEQYYIKQKSREESQIKQTIQITKKQTITKIVVNKVQIQNPTANTVAYLRNRSKTSTINDINLRNEMIPSVQLSNTDSINQNNRVLRMDLQINSKIKTNIRQYTKNSKEQTIIPLPQISEYSSVPFKNKTNRIQKQYEKHIQQFDKTNSFAYHLKTQAITINSTNVCSIDSQRNARPRKLLYF